jgi:hypothetical protein
MALLMCLGSTTAKAEDHLLVGGCTASGWNSGEYNRTPVAMVNVAENVWIWCGKITTGEGDNGRFKIPNSNDGWEGYWAPAQGTVLTSEWSNLSTNGTGDYKFCVAEEGIYKVTINTNTLKIKAEKLSEPTKDGDYYLLGGVADYYWYAGSVTSGENTLKARMTADLDFTTDGFFPLACDKFKFKGEFDGAGHTLSGINVIGANKNLGLCRYATGGTFIHHLLVDGSFTGEQKIAGLIGFARDGGEITLTNVVNKANVRATGDTNANASGFVGAADDGTKIIATNCANLGNVSGQDGQCAAFAGWTQGGTTFTNCYNSGTISNMENNCNLYRNTGAVTPINCYDATGVDSYTQGTKVDPALLATGELAFMLNGNADAGTWHQKLTDPKDAYPVPFGTDDTKVYANGALHCDGTSKGPSSYSNAPGSTRDDHDYANGFCTFCDTYQPGFMTANGSGIYEIETKYQMKWFSCLVNNENASANGQLMNDIDMAGITGYTPIGQAGHEFKGHFNGQGHRIKNLDLSGNAGYNKQGLFAETKDGAIIENLIMDATCTIKGVDYIAGILAYNSGNNVIVRNCGNEATVTGTGANAAGILGCSTSQVSITNCYNTGAVTGGRESAAICGWMGAETSVINHCFNSGTVNGQDGTNRMYRKPEVAGENLYDINGLQATAFTAEDMASGKLAFMLNDKTDAGVWHQRLSSEPKDAHPVPFGADATLVYANGEVQCDGVTPKEGSEFTYSNSVGTSKRDKHQFNEWGFCAVCNDLQPDFIEPDGEGYYNIGTKQQLNWFAHKVNGFGSQAAVRNINAKLTSDIDFSDQAAMIGGDGNSTAYQGTFDGQGHSVTVAYNATAKNAALFRTISAAHIMNLITRGTISNTNSCTGGIFAGSHGASVVENCVSYVTFNRATGGDATFGGIGAYMHDNGIIRNCAFLGKINASEAEGNGGILGYANGGGNVKIQNCLLYATINTKAESDKNDPFVRNTDPTDSYFVERGNLNAHNQGTQVIVTDVESGLVAYLLNGSTDAGTWHQTLGTDANPVPFTTSNAVYGAAWDGTNTVCFNNEANAITAGNVVINDLCDNFNMPAAESVTAQKVSYSRANVAGFNTVCLPFALTSSMLPTGAKIYTTGEIGATSVKITEVNEVAAGQPCLVEFPADYTAAWEINIDTATPFALAPVNTGDLKGSYTTTTIGAGKYKLNPEGTEFGITSESASVYPFRAYLEAGSGARGLSIIFGDETGINGVGAAAAAVEVYNAKGQRMQQLEKGVNIVRMANGQTRTVIVK